MGYTVTGQQAFVKVSLAVCVGPAASWVAHGVRTTEFIGGCTVQAFDVHLLLHF